MRYSASNPFIGKLVLKFLEVSHTKHGEALSEAQLPHLL